MPGDPFSWWRKALGKIRRPLLIIGLALGLGGVWALLPAPVQDEIIASLRRERELVGLIIGFALVTLLLLFGSVGKSLDVSLFKWINQRAARTPVLERLVWCLSLPGNGLFALLLVGISSALGARRFALALFLGESALWLLVELLKALTARARPYLSVEGAKLFGQKEIDHAYPSGHTAQAFFLAGLAIGYFQPGATWGAGLYALAGLVGFSRIYLGVHFPLDVLAGIILGTLWGLLAGMVV